MNYWHYMTMVLLGLVVAGCGGSDRLPVAGRVAVGGQPVDRGLVTFQPTVSTDSAAGASIRDGKFIIEAGPGLRPGTYDVSVTAMRLTGRKIEDPQSPAPVDEMVPMNVSVPSLPITISAENSKNLELDFPAVE